MEIPDFALFRWVVYLLERDEPSDAETGGQGCRHRYVGITNNIRKRLQQHNAGKSRATKGHQWTLTALAIFTDKKDAVIIERWLKCGDTRKKRDYFIRIFAGGLSCKDGVGLTVLNRAKCWYESRNLRMNFGCKAGLATRETTQEDEAQNNATE